MPYLNSWQHKDTLLSIYRDECDNLIVYIDVDGLWRLPKATRDAIHKNDPNILYNSQEDVTTSPWGKQILDWWRANGSPLLPVEVDPVDCPQAPPELITIVAECRAALWNGVDLI